MLLLVIISRHIIAQCFSLVLTLSSYCGCGSWDPKISVFILPLFLPGGLVHKVVVQCCLITHEQLITVNSDRLNPKEVK